MKKIKILYIHPTLDMGGAEEIRFTFLKYIDRLKYDVTLWCIGEKGEIGREIESLGYSVHVQKSSLSFLNILSLFKILKYLKRNPYDIVHTALSVPNSYGRIAALLAGVRCIIVEEHNYYERYPPQLTHFFKKMAFLLSKTTDKFIACSETVKRYLTTEEGISGDKIKVLYNAIDPEKFTLKKSKEQLRSRLGLNPQSLILGYTAYLGKRKGHIYLLKAFQKILQNYPDTLLLLIGEGPLEKELKTYVEDNGLNRSVFFLGLRRDIPRLLGSMDIFVSSALKEAFGINLIEAMYMALPCIATDVGGIPEVVKDGETGILVPPRDPDKMAEAIMCLLKKRELADKMGKSGRKRVEEYFLVDKYKTKMEGIYTELLGR